MLRKIDFLIQRCQSDILSKKMNKEYYKENQEMNKKTKILAKIIMTKLSVGRLMRNGENYLTAN